MNKQLPGNPSIDLYRRLTILILFVLFIIFTLTVIIIDSAGKVDTSTWVGKTQQFLLDLYPNTFLIPFAFLFGYLFLAPIQQANQQAEQKQLLDTMKTTFLPLLEERFTEKLQELFVPTLQTSLTEMFSVSPQLREMGILAVKPQMNHQEVKQRIAHSRYRVCIFDIIVFYDVRNFEDTFQQTALHNIPLRILLLDPQSAIAKQRLADIYPDHTPEETISIARIVSLYKQLGLKNLELKFHTTVPSVQIFLFDNEATVGFYFYGKDSQDLIQIEVLIKDQKGMYTPFGKLIEEEFEKRWRQGKTVEL